MKPNAPHRPQRLRLVVSLLAAMLGYSAGASADTLADAYRAARLNDPTFLAAEQQRIATTRAVPLAWSGLLPQLSYSEGQSKVKGDRRAPNSLGTIIESDLDYDTRSRSFNLRQPLINADALFRLKQSYNQADYGNAVFDVQEQELAVRVTQASLEFLLARYGVELADAQLAAYREQRVLASRRLRSGEGTRTEEAEAESRMRIAQSQLIEAKTLLNIAAQTLNNLTGWQEPKLSAATENYDPLPLDPPSEDAWIQTAQERSPAIEASRKSLAVAADEVNRNRSGHLPRLDLVGAISKSKNETINTLNQEFDTSSIGFQLNVPILAGGYVLAATDQAIANREKARHELEAQVRKTTLEVRRQFQLSQGGLEKVEALRLAVKSAQLAVEGAQVGLKAGFRTNLDVLDSQRVMFVAKRDLAQARYAYLLSVVSLKAAAGQLTLDDIEALDGLLHRPPKGGTL